MRAVLLVLAAAVAALAARSACERWRLERVETAAGWTWRVQAPRAGDELACGEWAPAITPGMVPYRCSRPADHVGAHVAELPNGATIDSWYPRKMAA